jgi:DNA primase
MEIPDIKQQLTLARLISYYGLKADKQNRLRCPFHDDRTPSLQLYYKTHTCYCFSSNCRTHGKSMDVIDFIMYYEHLTKRQAIEKAQAITGQEPHIQVAMPELLPGISNKNISSVRTQFLENMFTYFKNAVSNSQPARDYILSRGLNYQLTEIGYNSGQFHHGARKDEQLIEEALGYGLLLDQGKKSRTGEPAYKPFGKACICFALRDRSNNVASLYFRSIFDNKDYRHYYLKDRQGLYPCYPDKNTTKLILTESIIDAATLIEQEEIRNHYTVLALYGTNGLTEEHKQAINELPKLEEIIFALDNDPAGTEATKKYTKLFTEQYPHIKLSRIDLPCKDINETLLAHNNPEILQHLIETRTTATPTPLVDGLQDIPQENTDTFLSSTEIKATPILQTNTTTSNEENADTNIATPNQETASEASVTPPAGAGGLDITNPYNLKYTSGNVLYQIKGFKSDQPDSLKITLQIISR